MSEIVVFKKIPDLEVKSRFEYSKSSNQITVLYNPSLITDAELHDLSLAAQVEWVQTQIESVAQLFRSRYGTTDPIEKSIAQVHALVNSVKGAFKPVEAPRAKSLTPLRLEDAASYISGR